MFLAAAASVLATERPTSGDIEIALTLDRFDDSCADPSSGDGCPMINIYRVAVRAPRCRTALPAERTGIRGRYKVAVMCRFQSAVTVVGRQASRGWRNEEAMLFLVERLLDGCPADPKSELCRPRWRASPSPE
jgi:hypothetical protein